MVIPVASPPLDEITTSLLGLLRTSGRKVHDAVYDGDPTNPAFPYGILYAVPGGSADPVPDLDKRGDEITAVWQVTAVSNYRNQAQHLARVFHDLILGRTHDNALAPYAPVAAWLFPIDVPAPWQVTDRAADPTLAGVIRTGETPTSVFSAPFKFSLTITPS